MRRSGHTYYPVTRWLSRHRTLARLVPYGIAEGLRLREWRAEMDAYWAELMAQPDEFWAIQRAVMHGNRPGLRTALTKNVEARAEVDAARIRDEWEDLR